ncbi:MAG TPA: squalene/phytoene synthase family protein [Steroidobacteraceae bacterium]|jgi:phytoene synthase|nr:squalene/phytoene synthase family protein [Steroidobacteraceae bacterium]
MGPLLTPLEDPYRSRAAPPASARYWSWLFAAPESRDPLIGVYALTAEWRALIDPATEPQAAAIKLAWWEQEIARLVAAAPLHPITRFLSGLPCAGCVDFSPLHASLEAAARQLAGAPLERGAELEAHGAALWATPLMAAAHLARELTGESARALQRSVSALGAAQYLEDSIADYRRSALHGRVIFPVDELLAAGIEDSDLTASPAPERLRSYLDRLRSRAAALYRGAADQMPGSERASLRHLLVLATLGAEHSERRTRSAGAFRPADLFKAWSAARRATRHSPKH